MSKKPFLGFVLLTHEKPYQILRLIKRLNFMFDDPPIVCHHDFSKCPLSLDEIPGNVSFVKPHIQTVWGDWSLTEATLNGIELLFNRDDAPEWFILLSGTDYPIKPAHKIISDYKSSEYDAHILSTKLVRGELKNKVEKTAYMQYRMLRFKYPSFVHILQSIRTGTWFKQDIFMKKPKYTKWFIPFTDDFHCYSGSQWFSATRKAAEYILEFHATNRRVRNHYKKVQCSDESYFQTILNNSAHFNISTTYWRYVEWVENYAHPKELRMEDLEKLLRSEDHFARKFNMDKHPEILDRLDEHIGYGKENQSR